MGVELILAVVNISFTIMITMYREIFVRICFVRIFDYINFDTTGFFQ